jgi:hypothetical protein
MPYILMVRSDIPDGTFFVGDLTPNTSQRNGSIDPPGQTLYVNRVVTGSGSGGNDVSNSLHGLITSDQPAGAGEPVFLHGKVLGENASGLAAYLIDNCPLDAGTDTPMFVSEAADAADAIVALMDAAATDLTVANINAGVQALGATLAAFELTGGTSTASLADVLSILAGRIYQVPAGSFIANDEAANNGDFDGATSFQNGSFVEQVTEAKNRTELGKQAPDVVAVNIPVRGIRSVYESGSFNTSVNEGVIAEGVSGITLYGRSISVPDSTGAITGSPSKAEASTSTGYPVRLRQDMANKTGALSALTEAGGRVFLVVDDDGTIIA